MHAYPVRAIILRLLLLGLLVGALNLAVRPHQVRLRWSALQDSLRSYSDSASARHAVYIHLYRLAQAMPWRSDLWHAAGVYALWEGEWQSGLDFLERTNFKGLDAGEWLVVGDAYAGLTQYDRAEEAWRQSILIKESEQAYKRLYALHRQQADYPATVFDLKALTQLEPYNGELAYQLAVYLAAQDPHEALAWIDGMPVIDVQNQSRMDRLERKLRLATLADSTAVSFLLAGQGLAELGEWDLAKQAFQRSVQMAPEYAEAWAFLGEARQKVTPPEPEAALKDLRHALSLNPESVYAVSMLALYWQRQGDIQRASDLFRTAAVLEPQNPAWYAALGSLAGFQGELDDAEWYYQFAVSLEPGESAYYAFLANFYLANQIQINEKALPAALKALELDPDDPDYMTILAQVYLLLDDQARAVELLQAALQQDPALAKAHLLLGMAYLYQGQVELAHFYLLKASETAQDSATRDRAKRALQYYFP